MNDGYHFFIQLSRTNCFDFLCILFSIVFSLGVLYRSASVGKMFKNKFTTATGKAIDTEQIFGINSIGRKPIG